MTTKLAAPAVLGSFDGTASLLGVLVYLLLKHPAYIFPAALSGALSSAISMGAGQWLSESDDGLAASAVMAGATFCGAILPALPFWWSAGAVAVAQSAVITLCAAAVVARMRPGRSLPLGLAETLGLLAVVIAVTAGLGMMLPGGAG